MAVDLRRHPCGPSLSGEYDFTVILDIPGTKYFASKYYATQTDYLAQMAQRN